jgi:hypothetical protein
LCQSLTVSVPIVYLYYIPYLPNGWKVAKVIANKNGELLADLIVGYKEEHMMISHQDIPETTTTTKVEQEVVQLNPTHN